MAKALRVNHGRVDPDIANSLTKAEKEWLRAWNRHGEIPGEEPPEPEDDDDEDGDYSDMTNDELKAILSARDLPTGGNKQDLIDRLEEDDQNDE